jgi:hypothetical protein
VGALPLDLSGTGIAGTKEGGEQKAKAFMNGSPQIATEIFTQLVHGRCSHRLKELSQRREALLLSHNVQGRHRKGFLRFSLLPGATGLFYHLTHRPALCEVELMNPKNAKNLPFLLRP